MDIWPPNPNESFTINPSPVSGSIKDMYFYRKWCLMRALRKDCRKKGTRKEVSYSVLGSSQQHGAVIAKEGRVFWEIFVDWFAKDYKSTRPWLRQDNDEIVKELNSTLLDLEKEGLVGIDSAREDVTVVWMKPGANEFIDGFWWRALSGVADKWWGKGLILIGLGYIAKPLLKSLLSYFFK